MANEVDQPCYNDRWNNYIVQDVTQWDCEGGNPIVFPDNNTPIPIMFELNQETFTRVLSSMMFGANILYQDESYQTVQDFMKWIECQMALCEYVLDSFNDSPDCQAGLVNLLNGLGYGNGGGNTGEPLSGRNGENLNGNADCSTNGVYGVAYSVADMMNTIVEDFIDEVGSTVNDDDLAISLVRSVPVFGDLVATAFEAAEWLVNEVMTNYLAAWDSTTHDAVACAIYQHMCGDCVLTLDDLNDAYATLAPSIPPTSVQDWATWISWFSGLSSMTDLELVAVMQLFVVTTWRMGASWYGDKDRQLYIASQTASSLAPPMGCDCDLWCYEWDFTANSGETDGWDATAAGGEYTAGVGWTATKPASDWNVYLGMADIGSEITVTRIEVEGKGVDLDASNNTRIRGWVEPDFTSTRPIVETDSTSGNPVTFIWTGSEAGIESILFSFLGNVGESDNNITRVKIFGLGTMPSWVQGSTC